ncbi:hypothetical protein CCACVL1_02420 [Corchorus capsularis]|uniref:Transcription repressor n=1 Tax=Corchorus capsularis TaxID=210143 RepID=A0A1R3K8T3_COCAP|nr:hypothetical protein CCACVL1_02420 [Corchorus capsularis]
MENRFKLRISRMFRSSFGSCRTRNISDVIEKTVFSPQNSNGGSFHMIEPLSSSLSSSTSTSKLSPKARPFPSICKPRCPDSSTHQTSIINHDCIMITPRETLPRRKVSSRYPPFLPTAAEIDGGGGRKCPPASPISPLNYFLFSDCKDFGFYETKKKSLTRTKKKKKKNGAKRVVVNGGKSSSSQESGNCNFNNSWWCSSEDETETLFSSRTLSSTDSSESHRWRRRFHRKRNNNNKNVPSRRRRANKNNDKSSDMGVLPLEGIRTNNNNYKVKDSFAVVKSSSDPYNDFRTSMVEMIVERQIFAAQDLEQLLQCFLSLNSHHHHNIIVEVFTEIWETLFSNWS